MNVALAALTQDPPALDGEARGVLTDCSYGYLFAMSGQLGVVPDPDGSMESWVVTSIRLFRTRN
ncbi:MAG: hypothetical protein H7Z12_20160 [Rhodospirillaceae bacterium]|nr:hypothetical protein [Rhodospirillales bacterium]